MIVDRYCGLTREKISPAGPECVIASDSFDTFPLSSTFAKGDYSSVSLNIPFSF